PLQKNLAIADRWLPIWWADAGPPDRGGAYVRTELTPLKSPPSTALAPRGPALAPRETRDRIGELLVAAGHITSAQLRHARRIQAKIPTPKTLLRILEELRLVQRGQVQQALRASVGTLPLEVLLLELGVVQATELEAALEARAARGNVKLAQVLIDDRLIDEKSLLDMYTQKLGFPRLSPGSDRLDPDLLGRAPTTWYRENEFVPLSRRDGAVVVAFADPLDDKQGAAARKLLGDNLVAGVALRREIHDALDRYDLGRVRAAAPVLNENAIVQTANQLISDAADANASDIHVEPSQDRLRVRFRQDGVLVPYKEFPKELTAPLTSRLKIMGGADIAEKRRHQDGRILFDSKGLAFDIRLSCYVTIHGEAIVMRLLRSRSQLLDVREIGMAPRVLRRYMEEVLDAPSGVVIVTGPTGSGKTTTLYGSINYLNNPRMSIITAEDPVEYVIDGITQCSINPKINLTYEDTLKHIVRQDPDVIVIGEVRDAFSAQTAIQASMTGHKVLTTFHTEDSVGALLRLLDMGIEAFLIASTVVGVVAQRLVRRVCPECAEEQTLSPSQVRRL
ncbi:MAG: type II/IV secretion system protein, partial [Alphaproteobacteria bacterium]|nr:type II/IV secretion system protein [Alphaproteobacteria bacterium]